MQQTADLPSYEWIYPIADMLNALVGAGLRLDWPAFNLHSSEFGNEMTLVSGRSLFVALLALPPYVETLSGYGKARDWALALKDDLSLWKGGLPERTDWPHQLQTLASEGAIVRHIAADFAPDASVGGLRGWIIVSF